MKEDFLFPLLILSLLCFSLAYVPGCAFLNRASTVVQLQSLNSEADEFDFQRQQMVEQQLRARGIQDQAVLEAMSQVPRHRFVEPSLVSFAYGDSPLPIGEGQTISQPYIVAYMTEAAEISAEERVLEIGTGSGYQAAVLGEIAQEVYSIEIIPSLAEKARQILSELGYTNVQVKTGDGYQGWSELAPYDAILVTAAPDHIPQPLINQLAPQGKMVIPVGTWYQEMIIISKTENGVIEERTIPVRFVPLTREPPEKF